MIRIVDEKAAFTFLCRLEVSLSELEIDGYYLHEFIFPLHFACVVYDGVRRADFFLV